MRWVFNSYLIVVLCPMKVKENGVFTLAQGREKWINPTLEKKYPQPSRVVL